MATIYFAKWITASIWNPSKTGSFTVEQDRYLRRTARKILPSCRRPASFISEKSFAAGLINAHCTRRGRCAFEPKGRKRRLPQAAKKNSRIRQLRGYIVRHHTPGLRELLSTGVTTHHRQLSEPPCPRRYSAMSRYGRAWSTRCMPKIWPRRKRSSIDEGSYSTTGTFFPHGCRSVFDFSLSPDRLSDLIEMAKQGGYLWATHLAESAEELPGVFGTGRDLYFHISRKEGLGNMEANHRLHALCSCHNLLPDRRSAFIAIMSAAPNSIFWQKKWPSSCNVCSILPPGHNPFPIDAARLGKSLMPGAPKASFTPIHDLLTNSIRQAALSAIFPQRKARMGDRHLRARSAPKIRSAAGDRQTRGRHRHKRAS